MDETKETGFDRTKVADEITYSCVISALPKKLRRCIHLRVQKRTWEVHVTTLSDKWFEAQLRSPELKNKLMIFARSLSGKAQDSEDLVQQAMLSAWQYRSTFEGGNFDAWLVTILRNYWRSQNSRRKRTFEVEIEDVDGKLARTNLVWTPKQEVHMEVSEVQSALSKLLGKIPWERYEALMEVAKGESYSEIASHQNVAEGTIKSRVNRARAALAEIYAYVD
jgi:RNA polymerase sigma-70 factor (ECF subfamily)